MDTPNQKMMSEPVKLLVPWDDLERPSDSYTVRLTEEHGMTETYWGKDSFGKCLFILKLKGDYVHRVRSHRLRINGIEVDLRTGLTPEEQMLVLAVNDRSNLDLFHSLCLTLCRSLASVSDSRAALDIALNHLKRWQRFLAGGMRQVLTREQILGLYAELHVLRMFHDKIGGAAIPAWCGPDGTDQDFRVGDQLIEVKAVQAAGGTVRIASEHQLDAEGHPLFLVVVELLLDDQAPEAQSLNGLVADMDRLLRPETTYVEWVAKLTKAGYIQIDDYDAPRIEVQGVQVFKVVDDFPRLARSALSDALYNVRYRLRITEVQRFAIPLSILWE